MNEVEEIAKELKKLRVVLEYLLQAKDEGIYERYHLMESNDNG